VPIEPAFAIAVANQKNLYQEAFKRKVMIVTPSTLLAALRLVENLWENDNQKKNTLEIATEAGRLYDSFVGLLEELNKIKRQLGTVQGSFDNALIKLEGKGNLVKRVEKLRKLGAITSKNIDQKLLKNTDENNLTKN
jgi:DNA recombination protein RmuC